MIHAVAIGIDPGITKPAVAFVALSLGLTEIIPEESVVHVLSPTKKGPDVCRLAHLSSCLDELFSINDPKKAHYATIERQFIRQGVGTPSLQIGAYFETLMNLWRHGVMPGEVINTSVKKLFTGHGTSDKLTMIKEAERRGFTLKGRSIEARQAEADAIAIALHPYLHQQQKQQTERKKND